MKNLKEIVADINLPPRFKIMKIPLSSAIALSAFFGHISFRPEFNSTLFWTVCGVFLLSAGSASLNNYQDRFYDRCFARTRHRPLARRALNSAHAVCQAGALIICGTIVLCWGTGQIAPVLLGLSAFILYNFAYTILKTKTLFSIIPGAVCGFLPPYIGWTAAGGERGSPVIILIAAIFAVWQIPHYWMILLKNKSDFIDNPQFPGMYRIMTESRLKKTAFLWIFAFSWLTLLAPLSFPEFDPVAGCLILANAIFLASASFKKLVLCNNRQIGGFLPVYLNISLAVFICVSGVSRLLA